jgi:hypothetical protein
MRRAGRPATASSYRCCFATISTAWFNWSGVGEDDDNRRRIGGRVNDQVKCTNQQRSAVEITH